MLVDEVGKLEHHRSAVRGGDVAPIGILERGAGGGNCGIDVVFGSCIYGGDWGLITVKATVSLRFMTAMVGFRSLGSRWVDRLNLLAIAALHELPIDVEANGLAILDAIGGSQFDGKVGRHLESCMCTVYSVSFVKVGGWWQSR